jgi:hypothetical protein
VSSTCPLKYVEAELEITSKVFCQIEHFSNIYSLDCLAKDCKDEFNNFETKFQDVCNEAKRIIDEKIEYLYYDIYLDIKM